MHNHSYENEFNLHVNEISFSYEKMGTKTRFEEEAKGNSEMAYSSHLDQLIESQLACSTDGLVRQTARRERRARLSVRVEQKPRNFFLDARFALVFTAHSCVSRFACYPAKKCCSGS